MKLFIVRHGQTEDNAARIFSGNRDTDLTVQGHEEARLLGNRLGDYTYDFAFVSDLKRAITTMEYILSNEQYSCSPLLRERHFGAYEGKPVEALFEDLETSGLPREEFKPEGGESIADVEQRLQQFYDDTLSSCKGTGLIVAHGSLNRSLLRLLMGLDYEEQFAISQHNTCVNLIEGDTAGAFEAVYLNCTEHLQCKKEV